ncbi:OTU domain-containing protein 6B [Plectosphaerella plurivora]|uniref:OTU domain-containing protein 6B n=1 Tax=Plectosphaerella plurivora TaxID=936078 RepID=A0A9P8VLK7_9PEZI|nr:OTU domain-containing protein 6B [Plectosphaerella plurivora]
MEEPAVETLEQVQARHRKEQRDLVSRITSKKKNATKKTRKGVNDECAELERQLKERQAEEVAQATGIAEPDETRDTEEAEETTQTNGDTAEGVSTKLDVTSISEAAPPAKEAEEQQQQGGGKKRNRQKERLARRAAEQEEAAVKAEEEAANMTDHRGLEKKYMAEVFKANSLVEKDIRPDGHCLFSAVADQLRQHEVPLTDDETEIKKFFPYQLLRRAAAAWMEDHREDFEPFLEEELEGYVERIRETAEWGGNLELAALAARYGVEIRVVQDGRTETIDAPKRKEGEGEAPVVWLAFYRHGYGLGEHYNSLRKTT